MKLTKDFLIKTLKDYHTANGKSPRKMHCKTEDGLVGCNTYQRHFGSWNEALRCAGLEVSRVSRKVVLHKVCVYCCTSYTTKRVDSSYCSVKCAVTERNKLTKVVKISKNCEDCGNPHARNSEYCSQICKSTAEMKRTTIGEASRYTEQNRYRAVRDKGVNFYKYFGKSSVCENCDYDKHTEHCHIKAIKDFNENDSVWDCNQPSNMIFLCRNCHWELDYGDLTIDDIRSGS